MSRNRVDLAALIARTTAGREPDKSTMFRPSVAYRVLNDPFGLWCDFHAPKSEAVEETTRFEKLRMLWGGEYETTWVRKNHPDAVEIEPRWGLEALKSTLKAMLDGARAIHAPQLWALGDDLYGVGDVIVRCDDARSDLGPFHYRVREIKRSRSLKDYQAVQAVLYNRILDGIQGHRPKKVEVVLADGIEEVDADDFEEGVDQVLADWRDLRDGKVRPDLPAFDEASSPWRLYTNKLLEKRRDLTLCPMVSATARAKLQRKLGIESVEDLDRLTEADLKKALGPKTGLHFLYKLEARKTGRPYILDGARLDIPRRRRRLYFDFETAGDEHPTVPPHVYMIGVCDENGKAYKVFVAHGADDEAKMFGEFLDHVGNLKDAHLYHWTSFEIGQMEGVIERHPALKSRLSKLIKACVDLKEAIAKRVFFPCRTYSIKEVAPTIGFNWRQDAVDAMESMVLYWEWLADGDPKKIEKVVTYNEDDCIAMARVDEAIQRLQDG